MNRFSFVAPSAAGVAGEFPVATCDGVRLYDGVTKTQFDNGEIVLTSHKLSWRNPVQLKSSQLSLSLSLVVLAEAEAGSLTKSDKIVLHLAQPPANKEPGPSDRSAENSVKLSFKSGGQRPFMDKLAAALAQKQWEVRLIPAPRATPSSSAGVGPKKKVRSSGIAGFERSIQQKTRDTDSKISNAFQDLDQLMDMARPMVSLAKSISGKIRDRQGDISEDETVQFKSYLLSLGIADPVTRGGKHGSGQKYFRELAKEIFRILESPVSDSGGMLTLTDAFCRVNRARGLELLSPEDLLEGCSALAEVGLPLRLHTFESGVRVLRSTAVSDAAAAAATAGELHAAGSLTAEELARAAGVSVVLARERLLAAERRGLAARDDAVQALRFYPNRFNDEI